MTRTTRLYAIVEALRAAGSGGRTAAALAVRLDVSVRTIKRDMQALAEIGTAIRSQDGRGGGYQLDRAAALPPVTFSAEEATAIAVAVAAEPHMPFRAEAGTALAKLLRAMPAATRAHAVDTAGRVWMRVGEKSARPAAARIVDQALQRRVAVVLTYGDVATTVTRRRVDPLALARTEGHWYLLGWCHARQAGRWFRLDRIRRAALTRDAVVERDLRAIFGAPPTDANPVTF